MSEKLSIAYQIERASKPFDESKKITLDYDSRFLRRKRLICDDGTAFLADLPETVSLNDGDGFLLDNGDKILIAAAEEPVLIIRHKNLPQIAWHIGNRHAPCQIMTDHLRVRHDDVLKSLVLKLGAQVLEVNVQFEPEGGAYGFGRTHSHSH